MNENEFRERYAATQEHVTPSPELKRMAVLNAVQAKRVRRAVASPSAAQRWVLPAAACLATVALVAGGVPVVLSALNAARSPETALSDAAVASGFAVRAYAAGTDTLLTMGTDGRIIFDRAGIGGVFDSARHREEGFYTGCLFRVEGEGIARVQMETSRGVLYRQDTEEFRIGDDPTRAEEALYWNVARRGNGEHYGDCDNLIVNSSLSPDDPDVGTEAYENAIIRVQQQKLLGNVIDATAEEDPGIAAGTANFGLWTNEGYEAATNDELEDPFSQLINVFDGQTLTVTVTFDDGRTSTQVICLHAADMLATYKSTGALGVMEPHVAPEIVEDRASLAEGKGIIRSLYGTVTEATSEPFPGDLSHANEYVDVVKRALVLDRQPAVKPAEMSGQALTLAEGACLAPGQQALVTGEAEGEGKDADVFALSFPTVASSRVLPDLVALEDVGESEQDRAYANQVSEQVHGYRIDEDTRTISEGFLFATVTLEVTNTSDDAQRLPMNSRRMRELGLGEFAVVDGQGGVSLSTLNEALYFGDGGQNMKDVSPSALAFAPGETKQVTLVKVVSSAVLDDPSCLFVVDCNPTSGITQAFALNHAEP